MYSAQVKGERRNPCYLEQAQVSVVMYSGCVCGVQSMGQVIKNVYLSDSNMAAEELLP